MNCNEARYSRNIRIDGFGVECQKRLCSSSVLVVGCGALGSIAAVYLAASGIGRIGLADFDNVELSNLQRQIVFNEEDCGKNKAECVAAKIHALNSETKTDIFKLLISRKNADEIFNTYDFIIDATDNSASKYMIDEVCEMLKKPCCIAGVAEMRGQISTYLPGSLRFRDQFPDKPEDCSVLPCRVLGVIGAMTGVIGSLQAMEAIKYLSGFGETLTDKLFVLDNKRNNYNTYSF